MQQLDKIIPVARQLLTLRIDDERQDFWLWGRAERVARLATLVGRIPEVGDAPLDPVALGTAGLFHCAGWATQVQQGSMNRWQVLARPTNDIQRELGAALLQEHVAHLMPAKSVRLAAEAVRQCNNRETSLLEAQLLAEAENLDEVGVMYILRQFRQHQAEGRPLAQMTASWERQKEYQYWELRINDGFRFDTTRQIARARLPVVETFMQALARDTTGADLIEALDQAGVELPAELRAPEPPAQATPSG